MTTQNWIEQLLPLDRPEYAKQPEALLTDLIWRSKGSSLSNEFESLRKRGLLRLVPKRVDRGKTKDIVETFKFVENIKFDDLVGNQNEYANAIMPLLFSLRAPQARGDKSIAVVPIHPDVAIFQTLHGLVNKESPADLAKIIEAVGWLGGSGGFGSVAQVFLQAMASNEDIDAGLTGFLNGMIPNIAQRTWQELSGGENEVPVKWSSVLPQPIDDDARGTAIIGRKCHNTPFYWFWEKWSVLCNPENQWNEVLPTRRFVDWATCLLRTGLSFAYLWEANFFIMLHDVIREELECRKTNTTTTIAKDAMNSMLINGATLTSIEPLATPTSQKDIWPALKTLLARGYEIRKSVMELSQPVEKLGDEDILVFIDKWLTTLTVSDLETLSQPTRIESKTAENAREFVRYLLRPRSSDDDTADQADFYFLARTNKKADNFWLQPGPEWFVVATSLLSTKPGGTCSLGLLLDDLQKLGVRVDRSVLIEILEDAGLTTDSPDADDALVIASGF